VDPLTDVLNRRGLDAALDAEFARFRRYREDLSVVLLDIDHFKQFNDRLGHAAGDAVLVEMASLLRRRMRDTDVVGRLGGEEFALVLPRTGLQEAQAIVETLSNLLRDHTYVLGKNPVHVTTSWGVATTAGRAEIGSQQLLHEADIALYRAKNNGRDRVCVFAHEDEVDGPMLIPTRLRAQENQ
jgi:diguanylate cyclase (GGDEF)-like protein